MKGIIHSFQSMGAVDGPGLRYVIFMQGCPLRCVYCHNPDTWTPEGRAYSVEEVFQKIMRYRAYFGKEGGVTVSGGEPLLQWEFVAALFAKLKNAGIHTALDTSGIGSMEGARTVLEGTDLVLCDVKFSSEAEYQKYCKADMKKVLSFLRLTEDMKIPLWIRHVVVPGLTNREESLAEIMEISEGLSNFKKIEFLPFKKLCTVKYKALGIPFLLEQCDECPDSAIEEIRLKFGV
ncbi:pyruvate formate-lyase-activating protein [Sinanaerobacter chloroacetimidivorans]|uniref:Pyruvate formate-lyase-activating enzyme n=1 Tax=Sinanaerobacter chloroacetimidivorans TaxID=2818044 RepID=A0A8J7W6M5_9FIRM|nr:pyruvate formate-lyase-activating protein [Sinanaerobacter chloroacetimidivorans]MBR0599986.1 pyruvate formate lyase-activating protein [Sinanaerobacter chloroacetimidivorans]